MEKDKAYIVRKVFVIITLVLLFATFGLILIKMQMKTVKLSYFGQEQDVKTLATTVQSFLLQNNITISDNVSISPSLDSKITNGMNINLDSTTQQAKIDIESIAKSYSPTIAKIVETTEEIPFEEEEKQNASLYKGKTSVIQEGKAGQKVTRYIVKANGTEEVSRTQLDTLVASQPQNKITEIGTKVVSRSSTIDLPSTIITDEGFKEYNIKLPADEQKYAYNMCEKYGVQYELLLAIMYKESGYNAYALSGASSYGLCQIHYSNFSKLSRLFGISSLDDLYNPYINIQCGAYMLSIYFNSARNVSSDTDTIEIYALNSYNMGEGNYYNLCYSQGVLNRSYSTSVISLRNKLINNGGL